jgi:hypothetical protein
MREEQQGNARKGISNSNQVDSGLEQRFLIALGLYLVLAALAWFTLGEGHIFVQGKPVEIRLIPMLILGGLALRTMLGLYAERIRRGTGKSGK